MMEKLTKKSMSSAMMNVIEIIASCKHSFASELSAAGWNSAKSDFSKNDNADAEGNTNLYIFPSELVEGSIGTNLLVDGSTVTLLPRAETGLIVSIYSLSQSHSHFLTLLFYLPFVLFFVISSFRPFPHDFMPVSCRHCFILRCLSPLRFIKFHLSMSLIQS